MGDGADISVQDLSYEVDRVTGAPSMRYFLEYGDRRIRANRASAHPDKLSVVYTNLTNFKLYNIQYGFEAGDRLLRDVNQGLIELFPGHLIVRYSGDHFAAITKLTDYDYISKRIHELVERLTPGSTVSCKFGIVLLDDVESIATAVDFAKIACDSIRNDPNTLYRIYDDSLLKVTEGERYTLATIDRALDEGWIQVYYQPVVRTIAPSLVSFEALARWIDPELGMRSPACFIPALERAGIVWKLDTYMLDQICAGMEERLAAGKPVLPVSFNLSRSDFFTCDIRTLVNEIVARHGVSHRLLKVEVTESILVNDALRIQETLAGLRSDGFDIWIDDFGSGYSSLNVVKDFDFDEMKIDQRFLSKLDDKARSVISSTVTMAKKIGAQTLAEGVETSEAYDFLREVGCEKVQGYLFGKPAPFEQSLEHCLDEGLTPETADLARYYDAMGKVNFATPDPLAIVEDDGSHMHFLYANAPYRATLRKIGYTSREQVEKVINARTSPLREVFRNFAESLVTLGYRRETEYPSGEHFMRLTGELLATCPTAEGGVRRLFGLSLIELMAEALTDGMGNHQPFDVIRNAVLVFDGVTLFDYANDTVTRIFGGVSETSRQYAGVEDFYRIYAERHIDPVDRERFLAFALEQGKELRAGHIEGGRVRAYFRSLEEDGTSAWRLHTMVVVPNTGGALIVHAFQNAESSDKSSPSVGTRTNDR